MIYNTSHRRNLYVSVGIAITWILSIVISAPLLVVNEIGSGVSKQESICAINNGTFAIYVSIITFFLPSFIIAIQIGLIVKSIIDRARRLCLRVWTPNTPHTPPVSRIKHRHTDDPLLNTQQADNCSMLSLSAQPSSPYLSQKRFTFDETSVRENMVATNAKPSSPLSYRRESDRDMTLTVNMAPLSPRPSVKKKKRPSLPATAYSRRPELDEMPRERSSVPASIAPQSCNREVRRQKPFLSFLKLLWQDRAVAMLFIITLCFFTCWLPYFVAVIINGSKDNYFSAVVIDALRWLGHINSTMNPIIYICFNREFRIAIYNKLVCKKTHVAMTRSASVNSQMGGIGLLVLYNQR